MRAAVPADAGSVRTLFAHAYADDPLAGRPALIERSGPGPSRQHSHSWATIEA